MVLTITDATSRRKVCWVSSRNAPPMKGIEKANQKNAVCPPVDSVEAERRGATLRVASSDDLRVKDFQETSPIFVEL